MTTIGLNAIRPRVCTVLRLVIARIVIIYGKVQFFFFVLVLSVRSLSSSGAFSGSVAESVYRNTVVEMNIIFIALRNRLIIVRKTNSRGRRGNGPEKNRLHCGTLTTFDRRESAPIARIVSRWRNVIRAKHNDRAKHKIVSLSTAVSMPVRQKKKISLFRDFLRFGNDITACLSHLLFYSVRDFNVVRLFLFFFFILFHYIILLYISRRSRNTTERANGNNTSGQAARSGSCTTCGC